MCVHFCCSFDVPSVTQVPQLPKLSDTVWSEKHQVCSSLASFPGCRRNSTGNQASSSWAAQLGVEV